MPLKGGIGNWIKDFKKSDAPQFKGKSDEKKRDMAIAAYLDAKEEYREESGTRNIHEISKDLAAKYIKKRADDLPHAGAMMNDPHDSKRRRKGVRDYVKMQKGVKTAVNKLTGKAMVPATEATAKVNYFTGRKHAEKAGIGVKTHSADMLGGYNVTLSHPDKKKLQKYVDNHAGGAEQGVHVKENAYMVAKMARQSDDNLKSMMSKMQDAKKKDPNTSSQMIDHISKEMKKRGMKESTTLSRLKMYLNRS